MSRTTGTYTAPSSSWNPAVEGTAVDETDWNSLLDDIEAALTESVYTSGLGSTDNRLVRTDGTDTKKAQGSAATLDDSGNLSGIANVSATGYVDVAEIATPSNPAANTARLYAFDDSGTTKVAFRDSAGAETVIGSGDLVSTNNLSDVSNAATSFRNLAEGISSTQGTILYRDGLQWTALAVGSSGQVLQTQGAGANPQWASVSGTGDVTAAASFSNDNRLVRSDGTGKGVQASAITVDDIGNMTGVGTIDAAAFTGDSGSGGVKGLVPAPASGDAAANKFLKADGTWTAPSGSGDVSSNTAISVDSEIALFSSTGGKTIKRATTTGILKATSGVLSAATAGTDYYVPGGALGTPSSGTLTNATGLPIATGVSGLGTGVATFLATPTAGNLNTALGTTVKTVGKETIFIPAGAMTARTTNGAATGTTELATNDVMLSSLDFDQTTEEGAGFWIAMPKSWNESTVTFKPFWTAASGLGGVVWGLAAYSFSDDDAMDTAVSGQQTSTDTLIAANDMHIGPESSAITIGGMPAEGDMVYFEITREVANVSDTLSADAKLLGVHVYITTNASTDA